MRLPAIRGVIERRILVNYRVDSGVLAGILPAPFRPKLHNGHGLVGICLIRLGRMRPGILPGWLGLSSENAAHRAAVEWSDGDRVGEGVYIRRRDTNSWLNTLAGGWLFPAISHHAQFTVSEDNHHFNVAARSDDGLTDLSVIGKLAEQWPSDSVFGSLAEASAFFQTGSIGYSATPDVRRFHGVELRCQRWQVEPLAVSEVNSSYFDDLNVFPAGSLKFDCAVLMRGIEHEWRGQSDLCCTTPTPNPLFAK